MEKSRYIVAEKCLLFWTLFICFSAVACTVGMITDTGGSSMILHAMLPFLQTVPFSEALSRNLVASGVMLLIVNGLTNGIASVLLIRQQFIGIVLGGVFGATLTLSVGIQFHIIPLNLLSILYCIFGFCQAVTGYAAWAFHQQERFTICESDYPNISSNPKRLVVFFSRMGYTKKIAMEEANRTGATICELHTTEKTAGTSGFWWCGRYGMHRWKMPLAPIDMDLSQYEHITICSPIWVFGLCSPVLSFCDASKGKIRDVDLITVHFNKGRYLNALHEAEKLLGLKLSGYRSICCRFGKQLQE